MVDNIDICAILNQKLINYGINITNVHVPHDTHTTAAYPYNEIIISGFVVDTMKLAKEQFKANSEENIRQQNPWIDKLYKDYQTALVS